MPHIATGIVRFLQPLKIWVLLKKQLGFSKKILNFLETANCSKYATGIDKLIETLEIWVLYKKEMGFSKKILDFLKTFKGGNFAGQCD